MRYCGEGTGEMYCGSTGSTTSMAGYETMGAGGYIWLVGIVKSCGGAVGFLCIGAGLTSGDLITQGFFF